MKSVENSTAMVKAGKDEGRQWVERRVRKGERAKREIHGPGKDGGNVI